MLERSTRLAIFVVQPVGFVDSPNIRNETKDMFNDFAKLNHFINTYRNTWNY